jgi:hypothetical protein
MVTEMKNYALIETATTLVVNIMVWDGQPPWEPGDGQIAVVIPENSSAGIGWTYVDGEFIAPPEPEPDLAG